jgi:stress-induced-phosphoprotein 1
MTTAVELKNQGNTAFAAAQYEEAARLFSEAIALDATNHIFFSNRSASYA